MFMLIRNNICFRKDQILLHFRNFCGNGTRIITRSHHASNNILFSSRNTLIKNFPKRKCIRFKSSVENKSKDVNVATKITRPNKSDFVRLFSLAASEKWTLGASVGCLIVSSSITMAVPFCIGKIMDIISTENVAAESLTNLCAILLGVFIVGAAANFGRVYLMNGATLRIVRDIRAKLYRSMINQDIGWFDTKGTGELVNRLSTDTYIIGNSLGQNLSDGLRSTATIVAGATMMFYTSYDLAIVSLGVVPCVGAMAIIYGRYIKKNTTKLLDQYAETMKVGEERLNNIKTVKTFSKEEYENNLFGRNLMEAMQLGYKDIMARATFFGLAGFSGNAIVLSVLYYGANLVATESITIGGLTSFILYSGFTALSLGGMGNFFTELNKGIGASQKIWEIYDRKYKISISGGRVPSQPLKGEIIFEDVVFSFPTRPDSPILNGMNLKIKPGTVTAIVGRSGSGKTTIASMLLRLYDPQVGTIKLDGIDLRELNPTWLRNQIGAVSQEPVLFSGTIRENILYGLREDQQDVDLSIFDRVCHQAHVYEFVNTLPNGYDTLVGQRGVMLSGGQKQRVAIARALIRNPSILLLDEATSALDAVSEGLVQNAMETVCKGRTVLTIAHRLSTIRNAENIIVLSDGKIGEQGSYEELTARENGIFRDLVKKQTFNATLG